LDIFDSTLFGILVCIDSIPVSAHIVARAPSISLTGAFSKPDSNHL